MDSKLVFLCFLQLNFLPLVTAFFFEEHAGKVLGQEKISIQHFRKRSVDNDGEIHFNAFGNDYKVKLRSAPLLPSTFRIYEARATEDGRPYQELVKEMDGDEINNNLFEVAGGYGSLFVRSAQNNEVPVVTGFVDQNTYIHGDENGDHSAYRVKGTEDPKLINDVAQWYNGSATTDSIETRSFSRRAAIPDPVYVEVKAVLDLANSQVLNFDQNQMLTYFSVAWNMIQRRYDDTKDPKIRFTLSSLMYTANKEGQPYIEKNRVNDNLVKGDTLADFGHWLWDVDQGVGYDVALLHLKHNIEGAGGLAYGGYGCVNEPHNKKIAKVAIAVDVAPYYTGLFYLGHELGHLLNAPHDGDGEAASCPNNGGYLMGSDNWDEKKFTFSSCSLKIMRDFVRSDRGSCTWNKPSSIYIGNKLPGEVQDRDNVCRAQFGNDYTAYYKTGRDACVQQFWCCKNNPWNCQVGWARFQLEGSSCGDGKKCLSGSCV